MKNENEKIDDLIEYFKTQEIKQLELTQNKREIIEKITKSKTKLFRFEIKYAYVLSIFILVTLPFIYFKFNNTFNTSGNNPLVENTQSTSSNNVNNNDLIIPINEINDSQRLTYIVYNATMRSLNPSKTLSFSPNNVHQYSNPKIQLIENEEEGNSESMLRFNEIEIYQAHKFMINTDNQEFPFLQNVTGNSHIEVFIVFFGLSSDSYWFNEQMIIFKGEEGIYGCLGSTFGRIFSDKDKIPRNLSDIYFGSYIMLGNNELIKDYVNNEFYNFNVNLTDTSHIQLRITESEALEYNPDFTGKVREYIADENSYQQLSGSEIIKINELSYVEKMTINAIIQSINYDNYRISVLNVQPIDTIYFDINGRVIDSNGQTIDFLTLNEGDSIQVYYFKPYQEYKPTRIRVSTIIINNRDV